MNWLEAIPLVSVIAVVFMAGGVHAQVKAMRAALDDVKKDMKESAKDQGKRIGDIETDVDALVKWQSRVEGAEEKERDMSGVVRR